VSLELASSTEKVICVMAAAPSTLAAVAERTTTPLTVVLAAGERRVTKGGVRAFKPAGPASGENPGAAPIQRGVPEIA